MANAPTMYVYSTLTSDVDYTGYVKGENDMPIAERTIRILGGAGIMNDRLFTPDGIMTPVTADDLESLNSNPVFQLHKRNGFITVSADEVPAEIAAANMTPRDQSTQLGPDNFTDGELSVEVNSDTKAGKPAKRK